MDLGRVCVNVARGYVHQAHAVQKVCCKSILKLPYLFSLTCNRGRETGGVSLFPRPLLTLRRTKTMLV